MLAIQKTRVTVAVLVFLFINLLLTSFAHAATVGQITAALNATTNVTQIESIIEEPISKQMKCPCSILTIRGTNPLGDAFQTIQVEGYKADNYTVKTLSQSK